MPKIDRQSSTELPLARDYVKCFPCTNIKKSALRLGLWVFALLLALIGRSYLADGQSAHFVILLEVAFLLLILEDIISAGKVRLLTIFVLFLGMLMVLGFLLPPVFIH